MSKGIKALPRGMTLTKRQQDRIRAHIDGVAIVQRLNAFISGGTETVPGRDEDGNVVAVERPVEMTSAQVSASKILMDRVVPTLTASEVTEVKGQFDGMTEEQLLTKVRSWLTDHPELLAAIPAPPAEREPLNGAEHAETSTQDQESPQPEGHHGTESTHAEPEQANGSSPASEET